MSKKILLSPSAKKDFAGILEYLVNRWSTKVANNFIDRFEDELKRITINPEQFPYFRKDLNVRKCLLTKHNVLYFREDTFQIEVIRIYDIRQNPSKLKF